MLSMGANGRSCMNYIQPTDHIDPANCLVASAALLADAVIAALAHSARVDVSFVEMKSVSSSYFNMFLSQVGQRLGADTLQKRVTMHFSSDAQRTIFRRSFDAVLNNLAHH